MIITINTVNCSREEVQELKDYLEENCWNWKTDEVEESKEEPTYILRDGVIHVVGSHSVTINEKIRDEDLHEYSIIDRADFIDELYRWIGEAKDDTNKQMMKDDLDMLKGLKDDYIFSSNSTNSYISSIDSEFDETCKELIELNEGL